MPALLLAQTARLSATRPGPASRRMDDWVAPPAFLLPYQTSWLGPSAHYQSRLTKRRPSKVDAATSLSQSAFWQPPLPTLSGFEVVAEYIAAEDLAFSNRRQPLAGRGRSRRGLNHCDHGL